MSCHAVRRAKLDSVIWDTPPPHFLAIFPDFVRGDFAEFVGDFLGLLWEFWVGGPYYNIGLQMVNAKPENCKVCLSVRTLYRAS